MIIELKDSVKKNLYVYRHSRFFQIFTTIVILLGLLFFLVFVMPNYSGWAKLEGFILFGIVVIVILAIPEGICIAVPKRDKKDYPIVQEFDLDKDGCRPKIPHIEIFVKWPEISLIKEVEKYILFYGKQRSYWFTIYKERVSSEDLQSIKSFLLETPLPSKKILT